MKEINVKWEKVLMSLVGEQFDEAHILGAVLSIRGRETIIEIWFNYFKMNRIKTLIAEKFRAIVFDDKNDEGTLYFKDNGQSIVDKSTLRNVETHSFNNKRKYTYK